MYSFSPLPPLPVGVLAPLFLFFVSIGSGCTTSLIRVFAALGMATNLKTMTSEACKIGLSRSVDTGSSLVDCLTEAGTESLSKIPTNHYLNKDKYF